MATTARPGKQNRKGPPDQQNRTRAPAWGTGARASPTFSPAAPSPRLPNANGPAPSPAFPPLNGSPSPAPPVVKDAPHERVLAQLSGLTGTTITLSTKTGSRYEGSVASTSAEGDTTGVTLRDAKDLTAPGTPLKDSMFIAATNISEWSSGPADAKLTNGDSFKTDTDISQKQLRRERELQAWQPNHDDSAGPGSGSGGRATDEDTFGPGAGGSWDQFAANEQLFGVRANFDEDLYTTHLDRNAPDFKEKERRAAKLASEILSSSTNNVHIAEERVQNLTEKTDGSNEEDKYGAVVRSANAYVPPGARKPGSVAPAPAANGAPVTTKSTPEVPKVAVNAPDGSTVAATATDKDAGGTKPAADAVPAFRDFVSSEKDRLMKKKQALMKNEMDKRIADLVKFSQSFKLNKPIPDDLVPILAKDEDKQRQIKEKTVKDAESSRARSIGATTLTAPAPSSTRPAAANAAKTPSPADPKLPASAAAAKTVPTKPGESAKGRFSMVIPPIPPFKGRKSSPAAAAAGPPGARASPLNTNVSAQGTNGPLSPGTQNRLNANASSFRPTSVKPFSPPSGSPRLNGASSSASPKPKPAESTGSASPPVPNPFFGTRVVKKSPLVHIKEDFNPFKHNKVADASTIGWMWPYQGKPYRAMFPVPQNSPQPTSPHMVPPGPPPPMPPPTYEEDSAAQAAARGFVYAYPPYGYPGQPMQMMPGMAPPPPGTYIPGPPAFMQPMPYPMPPPNGMYPPNPMGQMPPYAMAPPAGYPPPPPPNGAGQRPSMPPTPIPHHAHPYYHQSPQLGHAVPYPMMMPPPGPPHGYDPSQAPPVQMGSHA